jgi:hypothetical protein
MKTPKDNHCAQVRTHAKAMYWMGRKGGNAKRKDQKKSVLSNVEVMQKFQMSKMAIKKNTDVEMGGVSATNKKEHDKKVLTKATLNVALTLERPWLGCKKEKHRDSHTCLSSHSLFCLQPCGLFCICGLWMARTHYLFLLFLSLCFDWKYLFSLSLGPLQNLV